MKFVTQEFTVTTEIKKSKFIAVFFPYKDFKKMMEKLKNEYPKARHHVYAYRYLNEFNQIVENSSDDGEPRGTSGRPSLKVLEGQGIINSAVIIVRFFGGIKLGTGGLVRAYSDSVNNVLNESTLHTYLQLESKKLVIKYNQLSQIEYLINKLNISVDEKIFESDISLHFKATKEQLEQLNQELPLGLEIS